MRRLLGAARDESFRLRQVLQRAGLAAVRG